MNERERGDTRVGTVVARRLGLVDVLVPAWKIKEVVERVVEGEDGGEGCRGVRARASIITRTLYNRRAGTYCRCIILFFFSVIFFPII